MLLQTTLHLQGSPCNAELELDFASSRWNMRHADSLPGVPYSDEGPFQVVESWGVIWLLDGPAACQTRTTMIIWDAPHSEHDTRHVVGDGQLYEPANAALKDQQIRWKVLR